MRVIVVVAVVVQVLPHSRQCQRENRQKDGARRQGLQVWKEALGVFRK